MEILGILGYNLLFSYFDKYLVFTALTSSFQSIIVEQTLFEV